jgi:hypothetical protein
MHQNKLGVRIGAKPRCFDLEANPQRISLTKSAGSAADLRAAEAREESAGDPDAFAA